MPKVTLANAMLRIAETQPNARQYLMDILTSKFTDVNAQNGQIVATTVNGKSMTLQATAGTSLADILQAAEMALSYLEAGFRRVPRSSYAVVR